MTSLALRAVLALYARPFDEPYFKFGRCMLLSISGSQSHVRGIPRSLPISIALLSGRTSKPVRFSTPLTLLRARIQSPLRKTSSQLDNQFRRTLC